jgi:hypothetical protein
VTDRASKRDVECGGRALVIFKLIQG